MTDPETDPDSTLVYRRGNFTPEANPIFPEDLRAWQPAVLLIRRVQAEAEALPIEAATTPDARTLAAILLWCLATGRYGSWDIEALCDEEPMAHHLANGLRPSRSDIHRYRRGHEAFLVGALARLLTAVRPKNDSGQPADATSEAQRRFRQASFADTLPQD
jgi:hypothetical protein